MRFESVTIAAGEKARCKSRPPDRARLNGFTAVSLPSAAAASVTSSRTPRRCSRVARVRRKSCSHQPETPDAASALTWLSTNR
jgi:hypothetical protein